jgi:hypothetical protein
MHRVVEAKDLGAEKPQFPQVRSNPTRICSEGEGVGIEGQGRGFLEQGQ